MNTNTRDLATILAQREYQASQGDWIPGNGRSETPTVYRTGRRLLWCYQPTTGRHAYLDCDTDLILSDEEARAAIGMG